MASLIIVDDEYNIIELVRKLIECPEIEIIGEALNGWDAYRLVCEKRPDILITDIRMPGCSGIELIEKVKAEFHETDIIVISGYRDFEYAHSALKFGVQEYLLKPIKKTELNSILKKLVKQKDSRMQEKERQNHLEEKLEKSVQDLRKEFLYQYILSERGGEEDGAGKMRRLFAFQDVIQAAVLKMDVEEWQPMNSIQLREVLENICGKLYAAIKEICLDAEYVCMEKQAVFFLAYQREEGWEEKAKEMLVQTKQMLKNENYKYGFLRFVFVLGDRVQQPGDIRDSYLTAVKTLEKRVNKEAGIIIDYAQVRKKYYFGSREWFTTQEYKEIVSCTEGYDGDSIMELFETVVFRHTQQLEDMSCAYHIAFAAVKIINAALVSRGFKESAEEFTTQNMEKRIYDCPSLERIKDSLAVYLESLFRFCTEQQQNKESRPIRIIKEYVNENYASTITLEDIARQVYLSPVYVSATFKAQTGMGFTAYLIEVRMDKAKQLLRSTGMNISEVARKVGYTDVKHFGKLFKKQTGINPAEYRRLFS